MHITPDPRWRHPHPQTHLTRAPFRHRDLLVPFAGNKKMVENKNGGVPLVRVPLPLAGVCVCVLQQMHYTRMLVLTAAPIFTTRRKIYRRVITWYARCGTGLIHSLSAFVTKEEHNIKTHKHVEIKDEFRYFLPGDSQVLPPTFFLLRRLLLVFFIFGDAKISLQCALSGLFSVALLSGLPNRSLKLVDFLFLSGLPNRILKSLSNRWRTMPMAHNANGAQCQCMAWPETANIARATLPFVAAHHTARDVSKFGNFIITSKWPNFKMVKK